jgi:hypothetical protein
MTHANPNMHSHLIHWRPTRNPRLIAWDIILVVVIVVGITLLATRSGVNLMVSASTLFGQKRSVAQAAPLYQPAERADIPDLISALTNPNPNVRIGAAELLGSNKTQAAISALLAATYDSNARVRYQAATALGEIGALQTLPRLKELEAVSGDADIELAAFAAENKISDAVAASLGVPRSGLQAIAISQQGTAFAAALNDLYAMRDKTWQLVTHLPMTPNDLSAGPDGQLLYLSSISSGLYRSKDGGKVWEHVQYGLQTPTQLRTTAVLVDQQNVNQIYAALAVDGSNNKQSPMGIVSSSDGGDNWVMLSESPNSTITYALIIDSTAPEYLHGLSDVGSWRYQLTPDDASAP